MRKDGHSANYLSVVKVNLENDPTQWVYITKVKDGGAGTVVASCYAASDDQKLGLCTALHNYRNLVYSLNLRDNDVQKLASIHKRVESLLNSWEVRGKDI